VVFTVQYFGGQEGGGENDVRFAYRNSLKHFLRVLLPPFSLIRDFGKQNTRGNVSKNFRQSYVLSTCWIEIRQSQPASMT